MRVVDRILAVIVGLILIGLVTIVGLDPESIGSLMARIEEANVILRLVAVMVINLLIVIALFTALRRRVKPSTGLAVKAPGSHTDVSVESARTLLLAAVEAVDDVVSAEAVVKAVNGWADIELEVHVKGDDIHVPRKQKEINRALRQVINKQLGLRMRGQPRVHIRLTTDEAEKDVTSSTKPMPVLETAVTPKPVTSKDEDTLVDRVVPAAEKDESSTETESDAETSDDRLNNHLTEKDSQSEI